MSWVFEGTSFLFYRPHWQIYQLFCKETTNSTTLKLLNVYGPHKIFLVPHGGTKSISTIAIGICWLTVSADLWWPRTLRLLLLYSRTTGGGRRGRGQVWWVPASLAMNNRRRGHGLFRVFPKGGLGRGRSGSHQPFAVSVNEIALLKKTFKAYKRILCNTLRHERNSEMGRRRIGIHGTPRWEKGWSWFV